MRRLLPGLDFFDFLKVGHDCARNIGNAAEHRTRD